MKGRKVRVREAAHYLSVSKSFLDKKRQTGGGPPYFQLSPRGSVIYDVKELDNWISSKKRQQASSRQTR
jgi:predicted DNA-binding transcriptional regulator AlpA